MRLKELEKEAKKEEILKVARKYFSEKGYEHTSMDEIAKKVKIAKGTVYLYFPSKQVLLIEILKFANLKVLEGAKQILKSNDNAFSKIKKIMKNSFDFITAYPEYLKIFPNLNQSQSDDVKELFDECRKDSDFFETPSDILKKIIEEGVNKGELKSGLDVNKEAFRVWSLMMSSNIAMQTYKNMEQKNVHLFAGVNCNDTIHETLDFVLKSFLL